MIKGVVNFAYGAVVTLSLHGPAGQTWEIEAVIDTGYNGFLTLPTMTVAELELPFLGPSRAVLTNESVETFNVHEATVLWDGQLRDIEADSTDSTPLVGMLLLDGEDLNLQVRDGGRVVIKAGE